jgi:hypothetical protein
MRLALLVGIVTALAATLIVHLQGALVSVVLEGLK